MAWTGWASLGGQLSGGTPSVARNADGRLEVFADGQGTAGLEVHHIWQTAPGGGWSAWGSLGAPPPGDVLGAIDVGRNADGRLEVFARFGAMSAGVIWHIWH